MIRIAQLSLLLVYLVIASEHVPEVRVKQGTLRGRYLESRNGRKFSAFTGVPFAKPPVGQLRFKAPVPAEPWDGILDATKNHAICPQIRPLSGNPTVHGSEDCLYLNVYTPQLLSSNKDPLPVIFYIHGGGFVMGSGGLAWYGPQIFMDKDVVLVIPNYRLGALGFLSTGDEASPGNYGLKDQNLALRWTKDNIAAFDGDPDGITVVGHSAGGSCAHLQVISPLSKGLLKAGVAQSGTAVATWAVSSKEEARESATKLAQFLDCPTSSSEAIVACLRETSVADIIHQDRKFLKWALDPVLPFKPVIEPDVEGAFLPEHPADLIKSGKAADIPFMTGITTDDGALKSSAYYANPFWIKDINKEFNRVMPISLQYETNPKKNGISKRIRDFYFGDKQVDGSTKTELTDMFTDVIFLVGADESVRLHKKHTSQPVYYYLFGYRGTESHSRLFGDRHHNYGVCHADELFYLFSLDALFPNYKPNQSDELMSEIFTNLLVNFAKTGNPTPGTDPSVSTKWEPVDDDTNFDYYSINSPTDIKMAKGLLPERAKFWRDLAIYSYENEARDEL